MVLVLIHTTAETITHFIDGIMVVLNMADKEDSVLVFSENALLLL